MQPLIKAFYHGLSGRGDLQKYTNRQAFEAAMRSALDGLSGFASEFAGLRSLVTSPPTPGVHTGFVPDAVWTFYALSRVADVMLLPQQAPDPRYPHSKSTSFTNDDLLRFFMPLGMTRMPDRAFSPAFHEVVEAVEDPSLGGDVVIMEEVWPGLMFGAMVFVRAGVRVLCSRTAMLPEVAGRSKLYFTYWRRSRPTCDLSHGWGSSSQWGTNFRRDYAEDGMLHYNVDGTLVLSPDGPPQLVPQMPMKRGSWERPYVPDMLGLTYAERIELLTNRCFVRTTKEDDYYWIFDDRYTEPDSAALR